MTKKSFRGGFDTLLGKPSEKNESDLKKDKEIRYTFLIEIDLLEQIKAISYWDRKMIKKVFSEALENYVDEYKKNKGELKLPH